MAVITHEGSYLPPSDPLPFLTTVQVLGLLFVFLLAVLKYYQHLNSRKTGPIAL